jgi:hypothetical protein
MTFFRKKAHVALLSMLVFIGAVIGLLWMYQPTFRQRVFGETTEARGTITQTPMDEVRIGSPFKLSVGINTDNQSVNAVGYYVHFDPNALQVLSLDTKSSFCQFYPEKKYDNINGSISLACGSPHPGFRGENTIMVIEFLPKTVGLTTIRVDPKSQILMSDGKGSNILTEYPATDVRITAGLE